MNSSSKEDLVVWQHSPFLFCSKHCKMTAIALLGKCHRKEILHQSDDIYCMCILPCMSYLLGG